MKECEVQKNTAQCACTYSPCSRKGVCCDCLRYHLNSGQFPGCLFPADVERGYDRSIENWIAVYQKRGKWW